jgi:hypothetical protein
MCHIDTAEHDDALKCESSTTVIMKGGAYHGYVHIAVELAPANGWNKETVCLLVDVLARCD